MENQQADIVNEPKNYIPLDKKIVIKKSPPFYIFIIVGILLFIILGFALYKRFFPAPKPDDRPRLPTSTIPTKKAEIKPTGIIKKTGWINYPNITDIRDIEVSGKDMWLAGLGSLSHIDQFNNKIIKTYTMLDGLVSNTTTAVKKQNEYLWIGSQGGINRISLKNGEIKSYTVNEGLINGSNIGFGLSGYDLWIGTFDGVSRYNTRTDSFINYKIELGNYATKWTVNDRLWIDTDGVWFIIGANAYSTGGVTFYNIYNNEWQIYTVKDIIQTEAERIDLFSLAVGKDNVWVTGGDAIYQFNKKNKTWINRTDLYNEINKVTGKSFINSDAIAGFENPYLYFNTNNQLLRYNIGQGVKKNVIKLYQFDENDNFKIIKKINKKIYYSGKKGIYYFDLTTNKLNRIPVDNIPLNYDRILSQSENQLILSVNNNVSLFNTESDNLTTLQGLKFEQGIEGEPSIYYDKQNRIIWHLSPAIIFENDCAPAKLTKYYLKTKQSVNVELPVSETGCGPILNRLMLEYKSKLYFIGDKLYIFDPASQPENQWAIIDYVVKNGYLDNQNQIWLLTDQGIGIFDGETIEYKINQGNIPGIIKEFIVDNNNLYAIITTDNLNTQAQQYNFLTQSWVNIDYPVGPAEYSPFEEWNTNPVVNDINLDSDFLWIASSRGLVKYDTKNQKFELFTTKEGLMGNVINQITTVNNKPWVIINWGGLAGFK